MHLPSMSISIITTSQLYTTILIAIIYTKTSTFTLTITYIIVLSIYLSIYQSLILLLSTICYLSIYLSTNTEFLSTVRNLFDPIRPSRSTNWTAASVDVPLESDAIALEYLSAYDYDVSKAYFNIFCDMGCGKGPTYMHAYIHSCIYIHTNTHAFNGLYTNFDVLHGMMYV